MTSSSCTAAPLGCAWTTGPSSPPRPSWTGVGRSVSASATSSPGSRIRMPSSSDSIARFVRRSSTPTSSTPSTRCRRSPTPGSRPTTPSGPTTASARCRPSCFCRGLMPPHSLVLKCLLDGEAYVTALKTALAGLPTTGNADADLRLKLNTLWRDLRTSQPQEYGWLLHKRGIVRLWSYWMWLSNGRSKIISRSSILLGVLFVVGLYMWSSGLGEGPTRTQTGLVRFHQWRFLKPNGTERDQWRSMEFLSDQLRHSSATSSTKSGEQTSPQRKVVVGSSGQTLLDPLLKELRFPSIGDRQGRAVLALVVNGHSPAVDSYVVPELIESLRTASETARLQIRNALLAIQKADYPGAKLPDTLAKWEPRKDESPGDIDERIRAWQAWWQTAERKQPPR